MASAARKAFGQNCDDIDRLLEIHGDLGGDAPGRRRRLEVLNKSAIVLITAVWEAYCEDIVAEGLKHLVANAATSGALPKALRKQIVKELGAEADELAVWQLADTGWRAVLEVRVDRLAEERNRRLNTPKTGQINELFLTGLGIPKISATWNWKGMTKTSAEAKLDRFIELRGTIAHRGGGRDRSQGPGQGLLRPCDAPSRKDGRAGQSRGQGRHRHRALVTRPRSYSIRRNQSRTASRSRSTSSSASGLQ